MNNVNQKKYAEVIVDISNSEVDRVFDYKFTNEEYALGSRVEVPFGRQTLEGFIIGIKPTSDLPDGKIKPIIRCLDEFPVLSAECLSLARFVKERYHVPFALALRQFIPAELRGGRVKKKIISFASLSDGISPVEMVASLRKGSTAQANAIGYLKQEGKVLLSVINEKFGNSAVKSLREKGFVVVSQEKAERMPYKELDAFSKDVTLSAEQENAIKSVESTQKTVTLIHGVTGSGKTEIYLRLINSTL